MINSKNCNSVQFSSHLLTRWLNRTSVNYSAQIQHKYNTNIRKRNIKQNNNINRLLTRQPPTWIDHITLRYITLPMPTQQPQTVHMTNTKCTLTHTTYYRVKNSAERQENTHQYLNYVITPTNAHAPNMFYRTLLISNMFRQLLRSSSR